jgi:putative molybdopterin biosynthesis protein
MMSDDTSYTPEELAQLLKISRFTVYEIIKRGDLVAYRIGRKMRVEASELDRYKKRAQGSTHQDSSTVSAATSFTDNEGLVICGQDVILDVLTRHLEKQMPNIRFLRNYASSMDGLQALYRGTVNVVAAHLWDGTSGEYNIPYVRHLLPGQRAVIINLLFRNEGFFVAPGNPKAITTWADLIKPTVQFVNREKGSGVRVLLDEQLRLLNLDHRSIQGYDQEETSHLAIASCVARGEADVGIGIEKVAMQVPNIDFIPLQKERCDLVMRKEDLTKPHFKALLSIVRSPLFRNEIAGMGGYDVSRMGETIAEF